jgi:hypothetical protein
MHTSIRRLGATALVLAAAAAAPAAAQTCTSPDPADWPLPSKPYVLVIADTSGSMANAVTAASTCGFGSTRSAHLRCALHDVFEAWAGRVSFGLATFATRLGGCDAACTTCVMSNYSGNTRGTGCGSGAGATAAGANIRVPLVPDAFWTSPPPASNLPSLRSWVDGSCAGSTELFADGLTPINGALRDARRYLATSWTNPENYSTYPTPLASQDRAGDGVNGSTGCRPVHVILLVDGDETCDTQADAVAAAQDLYTTGVTVGGKTFKVPVHVVNFIGATPVSADAIAAAGGTGAAVTASNERELGLALQGILAALVPPETCNNQDDDCNGCVDEGFPHHADVLANSGACCHWKTPAARTTCGASACGCCDWASTAERTACLAAYGLTVTPGNPQGDRSMLPCTTYAQAASSATWLCVDPGDVCDGVDNNGDGVVDEGQRKCGSPLHCPTAEICNGLDDDCDGQIDEGGVCGACAPSTETCDGCDNDCDGIADNGVAGALPCGVSGPGIPAYCAGTRTCRPATPVPVGTCAAGGGYGACTYPAPGPQPETCNGLDDDCNGLVDDGVTASPCVPNGAPAGLVYGGTSQCVMGSTACVNGTTVCAGWVGPSAEVCDGIDNDCDGTVDDGAAGVGVACGSSVPPCSPGVTACVNGALVCSGGVQPQAEVCDGVDNDCNGVVDDGALADAPAPGHAGCWSLPGMCCSFLAASGASLGWCPPVGATCDGLGVLQGVCHAGVLACDAGAWTCRGDQGPAAEACNGLDDDCDGEVDEGVAGAGGACRTAEGECTAGVLECTPTGLRCSGVGPVAERCDGKDNDCNGVIDDGIDCGAGDACARVTCPAGARCTLRGSGAVCVKTETETSRSGGCGSAGGPGSGAAVPALLLAALLWTRRRRGAPGRLAPTLAAALLVTATAATGCGSRSSTTTRETEVAPQPAAGCTPTNGGVERCDGLDNDCNGIVDDVTPATDPALGTTCSGGTQGACADPAHVGTLACSGGRLVCAGPAVLRPFEQRETCNGVDDDCNGVVDDDPVDAGTTCGTSDVAPCRRGRTVCHGGALGCAGAVEPAAETCNGVDDDCDGVVDDHLPASQSGGACLVRPAPPPGATSPCHAGTMACSGGALECVGAVGPSSTTDGCGVDANCDGVLTNQPDLQTDVHHCGACGNDCTAGAIHASWACVTGTCQFQGCQPGYWDNGGPGDAVAGDHRCGYACTFVSAQEACNGADDNCDGQIDEPASLVVPSPSQACGVSAAAATPECTPYHATMNPGGVSVACLSGAWQCTFHTAHVCSPTCAAAVEICDALDNDCDGLVNENVPDYGQPCASDDGLALGHGVCRTTGTRICASATATTCSATKDMSKAGPELCNGLDDDCDGLVDDTFNAPGPNGMFFVRPAVTRIGPSLWIYSFEASRANATAATAGSGNGYWTSAPAGTPSDRTRACSVAGRLPWFDVTPAEAEQTCAAAGGRLCTAAEWRQACQATASCTYGYAPRGSACTTASVAGTKECNLGSYDFASGVAGDQDGLLPAGSGSLASCWADWSGLQGNAAGADRVHDLTGNLRELVGGTGYVALGGSFLTVGEDSASCSFDPVPVASAEAASLSARDAGFRCCFDVNPSP